MIKINEQELLINTQKGEIYFFDIDKKEIIKKLPIDLYGNTNLLDIAFIKKNHLYITISKSIFDIDITKRELIGKFKLGFVKVYSMNNKYFGITEKKIYNLKFDENGIVNYELIFEDTDKILSLIYTKEKKLIFCTSSKIAMLDFN